jgi:DNA polymerase-3 subunit epsilon
MFASIRCVQLALDAVDRLVELIEERGPLEADAAARNVFRLVAAPDALARTLVSDLVAGDARLSWQGRRIGLAGAPAAPPVETATYVVFDLETTGLSAVSCRMCEIGAAKVRGLELVDSFETLVNPHEALPPSIAALTGLRDDELRRAPSAGAAVKRFMQFAGDAVLVAHNARFDASFLNRELERLTGRRLAAPVLDTVGLARRLLTGRTPRASLASLAFFFGTAARPCHRALPDAEATAEILIRLIGLAQERGARTVDDLHELAAPRKRRVYGKRSLAHGAPSRPGVYLFHDRNGTTLYVGRARDLRARLRSYFRSERQRPALEAALAAVERIEWRVLGSELEAAFEELRLIRELKPPANVRNKRPDRYLYLRRRGEGIVVSQTPGALGPITSRRQAELAARALASATEDELERLLDGAPLPRLNTKLRNLSDCLRYEDAARLRDRIAALEKVIGRLRSLERLRRRDLCLVAPAVDEGWRRAFFVAGRLVAVRGLPPGPGAALETEAGWAAVRRARAADDGPLDPEAADELVLAGSFVRRPPPELQILERPVHGLSASTSNSSPITGSLPISSRARPRSLD